MVDVEQDIMSSNADFDLRSKISSLKEEGHEGIPKKWWIIGGSVLAAIIIIILLFLFVFNTTNVNFTFYLNDALVTENLDVTVSYADTVLTLTTIASTLSVDLPNKTDVTLEVTSVGYQTTQVFFIEEDAYDVKIKKATTLAELGGEETEQEVSFYVYKYPSSTSLYSSTISLNLKCLSSGKTEFINVSGSKTYTKAVDCGSLQVTGSPSGFKAISQTCTGSLCNIMLYGPTDLTPQQQDSILKNNLIVKVVTHKKQEAMSDVNVSLEKGSLILSGPSKTDVNGEIIFYDVPVGNYTIVGEVKVKSKTYQEFADVEVYASSAPVKKTLEFDLKKGSGGSGSGSQYEEDNDSLLSTEDKTLYLTVNTFDGVECEVGAEIFTKAGDSKYDSSVSYPEGLATGETYEIGNMVDGNYYLSVIPLVDSCFLKYSPRYNEPFKMPDNKEKTVTLEEFDKDKLVILNVYPTYNLMEINNVMVDVYDSDFNKNKILSDPGLGDEVPFVLYKNKKYNILGNKNDEYKAEVLNYNFPTAFQDTIDSETYWVDILDLNLTHESAEVTFNVSFEGKPLESDKKFTISANIASLGDLSYTGTGPSKKIEVPKNTETLFKVLYVFEKKEYNPNKKTTTIKKTAYNYYVNPLEFSSDVNLNIDFSENLTKPETFSPKIYLDKALQKDDNNLNVTAGKQYYVPLDIQSIDGFLGEKIFSIVSEDLTSQNFFDFSKSEAYSLSTTDFNFYSVVQGDKVGSYLNMNGNKTQKDIFRIVLPVKIKSGIEPGKKGILKYTQALDGGKLVDGNIEFWTGSVAVAPFDVTQSDVAVGTGSYVNQSTFIMPSYTSGNKFPKPSQDNIIDVNIGKQKILQKQSDTILTEKYPDCNYKATKVNWVPNDSVLHTKKLVKLFGLDKSTHVDKIFSLDSKTGVLTLTMDINQDALLTLALPSNDTFKMILVLDLNKVSCSKYQGAARASPSQDKLNLQIPVTFVIHKDTVTMATTTTCTEATCKTDKNCIGQEVKVPSIIKQGLFDKKYCIWSPLGSATTVDNNRKALCSKSTDCVDKSGTCYGYELPNSDATYLCGGTVSQGDNSWVKCDAANKFKIGNYHCENGKWIETYSN